MGRILLFMTAAAFSAAVMSCSVPEQPSWQPAGDHIMTEWADGVNPAAVLPEYPRPQMARAEWKSLNGLWDYAVTPKDSPAPEEYKGSILVPFAIESALSGVGRHITADDALWYRTTFRVPRKWLRGGRGVRLNFQAVDWAAEVWVNGVKVADHTGGYTAFTADPTSALRPSGEQELVVKVLDATDNDTQPRGKQVSRPSGIWYTSVSGIWQSVWMEPVGPVSVRSYSARTSLDGTVKISFELDGAQDGDLVECRIGDVSAIVSPGGEAVLKIDNPRLWSPDSPALYNLTISCMRKGKEVDRVEGYTAFREISVVEDSGGRRRMALNGEPLFQFGPLDQGWWPDGLYTAPTDDALRFDIEKTRDFGYNMIRKHIKVEPERWYYWCDKLGIMVWQDMPSMTDSRHNSWHMYDYGGTDWDIPETARNTYYKEWGEIISQLKNHPCIVVWVPFNEGWAQFDTREAVAFTKGLDPDRLVNPASGGNFVEGLGDILDVHHYPDPQMPLWDPSLVNVLGEYGGIGYAVEGHLWQPDRNWGYVQYKSGEEVLAEYTRFADKLSELVLEGCAAAVYTQTTDVEIEVNGLMTYDRKVVKMDESGLREANRRVIGSMKP